MAVQILAELEQAVEVKLDHGSKSTRTRDTRRTRATAYRVAGVRITTRLRVIMKAAATTGKFPVVRLEGERQVSRTLARLGL
jgi:hypothetical protein